ncbi:MAG: S8 family peptidase [Dermatophilaceae bacterium]
MDAKERFDRQIDHINDRKRSRKFQKGLLKRIREDRRRKGKYAIDAIDLAPPPGSDVAEFVVALEGVVLVLGQPSAQARKVLADAHFTKEPSLSPASPAAVPGSGIELLSSRVARYTNPTASLDTAASVVRDLRNLDVHASVNYVLPLGYVAKGEGGFEPAAVDPQPGPGPAPGAGAKVAVIDTGIAAAPRNDGWLANIDRVGNLDALYQGPPPSNLLDYAAGHGTFVAGIIQQVAPTAQIRMYRAIGTDGIGNDVQVAEAILLAAADGADIINLSLGTPSLDDGRPVATQAALEILAQNHGDVVVVASAGNTPSTQPFYPAAFPGVVAVASLQADLQPSEWSSRGPDVAYSVVGEGVRSTYVVGQESEQVDKDDPDLFTDPSWAIGTGTSFAAPQIVGKIADLMAGTPGRTAREAYHELPNQASPATPPVPDYGIRLRILPGTAR